MKNFVKKITFSIMLVCFVNVGFASSVPVPQPLPAISLKIDHSFNYKPMSCLGKVITSEQQIHLANRFWNVGVIFSCEDNYFIISLSDGWEGDRQTDMAYVTSYLGIREDQIRFLG